MQRSTLKAPVNEPRNTVVQKSLSHFPTKLLGMFAEKKRAKPDEKASVMKELPSDIWHPLLSSSLKQQGDRGGKFWISASKMAQCSHVCGECSVCSCVQIFRQNLWGCTKSECFVWDDFWLYNCLKAPWIDLKHERKGGLIMYMPFIISLHQVL